MPMGRTMERYVVTMVRRIGSARVSVERPVKARKRRARRETTTHGVPQRADDVSANIEARSAER